METEGEGADGPDNRVLLKRAMESALVAESSWQKEQRNPEYREIKSTSRDLYRKLRSRRTSPEVRQAALTEMAYDAAHNLMGALAYLLEEPLEIGNVSEGPGGGVAKGASPHAARIQFIGKLKNTLKHLGIEPDELKDP